MSAGTVLDETRVRDRKPELRDAYTFAKILQEEIMGILTDAPENDFETFDLPADKRFPVGPHETGVD